MSKKQLRLEMLLLIEKHNKEDVCFVECKGCPTCEKIQEAGDLIWGLRVKDFPSFFKKFFDEHSESITYYEASKLINEDLDMATFYRYRKLYKKGELDN